jgi:Rab-GTPase-TBC domain
LVLHPHPHSRWTSVVLDGVDGVGYVQGMSDLLSVVYAIMQDDSDAFWCFCGFMDRMVFPLPFPLHFLHLLCPHLSLSLASLTLIPPLHTPHVLVLRGAPLMMIEIQLPNGSNRHAPTTHHTKTTNPSNDPKTLRPPCQIRQRRILLFIPSVTCMV